MICLHYITKDYLVVDGLHGAHE